MMGLVPLEEERKVFSLPMCLHEEGWLSTEQKGSCLQARKRALTRDKHALEFPASRLREMDVSSLMREMDISSLTYTVCGILLQQPEPTKTNDNEIKRGKRNREMWNIRQKICVNIPSKTGK